MSKRKVHLNVNFGEPNKRLRNNPHSIIQELDFFACGQFGIGVNKNTEQVTCLRCKRTKAYREEKEKEKRG